MKPMKVNIQLSMDEHQEGPDVLLLWLGLSGDELSLFFTTEWPFECTVTVSLRDALQDLRTKYDFDEDDEEEAKKRELVKRLIAVLDELEPVKTGE